MNTNWQAMNFGFTRQDVIEAVRVELLRHMERQRIVSASQIAADTGYSVKTIYQMISAQYGSDSLQLAQQIVLTYPEIGRHIGEPLVCKCCGRIARP
jgi:predicted DNA-binding transcriptional regulator AlpA